MVDRFNILADNDNFDFEAWFNDRTESDRSWVVDESSWNFRFRYMKTIILGNMKIHFPLPLLTGRTPDVLVSLYAEPSFLLGWAIARLKGVRTGFRVVATFDRWVRRTIWKESFKKWLFPRVDFIITEGNDGRNFALRYGAMHEKIFYARHGIDVSHFSDGSTMIPLKRLQLREKICVTATTFIYVGRMLRLKGLECLLDAFKKVQSQSRSEVCLILVGDGIEENYFRIKCKVEGIKNVIFAGFRQNNELPKMYAAADVFVFPTLGDPYGLVVDEAMACRLPVITTSAVGEIHDRVKDGLNGYIVPPENRTALANAMMKLVTDPKLRRRMGALSAERIAGHTHEKWVKDFERIVFHILDRY
jgi:glycosyltransferase involved in cell wall biosynthesis